LDNGNRGGRGSSLSGGQQQLVSLARAILGNPPVLLLDEPTNGLDAPLEANLVRYLSSQKGKSTILVSAHSRNLLSICDRIIVIGQSRLLADGPTDKILGPNAV
jgi:ABC-type bacteriocin/lantibiotic exporter with double-glycine peptidase domain